MLGLTRISSSQEQLLHQAPFAGDSPTSEPDTALPVPSAPDFAVASASVVMEAPPDTQDQLLHQTPFAGDSPTSEPDTALPVPSAPDFAVASASVVMEAPPDTQEQLFHQTPFAGDSPTSEPDTASPVPSSPDFAVASASVVMEAPPDTQDEFHTPPEESSLPSSDVDVGQCVVNRAFDDVDAGTQGFVYLGGCFSDGPEFVDLESDSELGFSDARLQQQETCTQCVADCEVPECPFDESVVLESDLGDSPPVKKLKLSEQNSLGAQLQKVDEGMGNCNEGKKLVSEADTEMPCNFEDDLLQLQPQVNVPGCEQVPVNEGTSSGDVNLVGGKKSSDKVTEGSGMRVRSDDLQSGSGTQKKNKYSVFDVLRVLAENENEKAEHNVDADISLLEAAVRGGMTFPRPNWWPDHYSFGKKN